MMQAEYKREDHKSYFVIRDLRLDENREETAHDLGMLCENRIDGLLPVSLHSFNGQTELYYDISNKQSLQMLYEKKELHKEDLKLLFEGLEMAVSELENYFLDMEHLIIDPEYIYINLTKGKIYLLYYPFQEENFEESVLRFSDYLLDKICNDDEQTVMYAYNFYRLVKEEGGDLTAVLKILQKEEEITKETYEAPQNAFEEESFYQEDETVSDIFNAAIDERQVNKDTLKLRIAIFGFSALFGIGIMAFSSWQYGLGFSDLLSKTESIVGLIVLLMAVIGFSVFSIIDNITQKKIPIQITEEKPIKSTPMQEFEQQREYAEYELSEDCGQSSAKQEVEMFETVLLQENCYSEQRILKGKIRGKTRQIDLAVFPFIIGKSKEQVDFIIEDSSISRIHARFTLRDEIVFLTDLNSTNGTMKNGIRLQPNELVPLESGDEICFGKVVFTYY